MLFAAGLGSRLGKLTDTTPKALVRVGDAPALELVARRLIGAGVHRLIINTHHLADQIVDFVESRDGFGIDVVFSPEETERLETGGGLRHAAHLFEAEAPIFLHNSDIISEVPLSTMYREHLETGALATLATMHRQTSRRLLFDEHGLFGRVDDVSELRIQVRRPVGEVRELAFAGIHVVAPELPARITETGVFSILEPYLRLAAAGERIVPMVFDDVSWVDIGKPEQLEAARQNVEGSGRRN